MDNLPLLLLVEDEPLIRTALAAALEDGGYGLVEAENGPAAIKAIESNEYLSGVITDIRLGSGADGWEVARHARHHFPKLAVVYMTGDSAADWTAEGVPNSVLLQKPFASAQVITAVSTLLNVADTSPTQANPAEQ
jgi:CheY-like chemotaxis protein